MKTTITLIATLAALSTPALAGGHTANDRAQSMKSLLAGNGKNGGIIGLPGASVASTLRRGGANEALGTGGWGNIGSALANTATSTPVSPAYPKNIDLTP
ncbi:MAG: hypothetical protein ACJAVT_000808 [Yoonia sp.]|jgi:hypothetical protein